jgi:hypothetical protein
MHLCASNGTAYVAVGDRILAIGVAQGTTKWSAALGENQRCRGLATNGDALFVVSEKRITVRDRHSGAEVWRMDTDTPLVSWSPQPDGLLVTDETGVRRVSLGQR